MIFGKINRYFFFTFIKQYHEARLQAAPDRAGVAWPFPQGQMSNHSAKIFKSLDSSTGGSSKKVKQTFVFVRTIFFYIFLCTMVLLLWLSRSCIILVWFGLVLWPKLVGHPWIHPIQFKLGKLRVALAFVLTTLSHQMLELRKQMNYCTSTPWTVCKRMFYFKKSLKTFISEFKILSLLCI